MDILGYISKIFIILWHKISMIWKHMTAHENIMWNLKNYQEIIIHIFKVFLCDLTQLRWHKILAILWYENIIKNFKIYQEVITHIFQGNKWWYMYNIFSTARPYSLSFYTNICWVYSSVNPWVIKNFHLSPSLHSNERMKKFIEKP